MCVHLLISKGANLRARELGGRTPMELAQFKGHTNFIHAVTSYGIYIMQSNISIEDQILSLAHLQNLPTLKQRLEMGLDPNFVASDGRTLLFVAGILILSSLHSIHSGCFLLCYSGIPSIRCYEDQSQC